MLGHMRGRHKKDITGKKRNKKISLQDGLEGGTGEDSESISEEILSPISKTGAERGWLEQLACSILGHLSCACLDYGMNTCRLWPGDHRGSAALLSEVPHFPWPMSASGCGMTEPSMPHFGCWGE